MTIKTFSLGLVIALIAAVFAAVLTVVGTQYLSQDEQKGSVIRDLFSSSEESVVEFVEIKNVVVTLKSQGDSERYLLLELALATNSAADPRGRDVARHSRSHRQPAVVEGVRCGARDER